MKGLSKRNVRKFRVSILPTHVLKPTRVVFVADADLHLDVDGSLDEAAEKFIRVPSFRKNYYVAPSLLENRENSLQKF